jgi:1-deoxy-D-xylulose-5-phosphate reductoisomerase
MIKIIAHDTNMKIPIFNTLYNIKNKTIQTNQLNVRKLNFLNFKKVDTSKFPSIKILKKLQNKESLLETVIVLGNDELVNLFLLKKINFTDITFFLQKLINMKEIINLNPNKLTSINSIISLKEIVRKKINKIIN